MEFIDKNPTLFLIADLVAKLYLQLVLDLFFLYPPTPLSQGERAKEAVLWMFRPRRHSTCPIWWGVLAGLVLLWGFAVSDASRTVLLKTFTRNRSCHCSSIHSSIHYMVFARFFHAFEAACLVMSGIGVGLSSSFLWASEGDVRQFFGGWFVDRLGLNPAGVWAVSAPCRTEAGAATEAAIAAPSTAPSTTWFLHSFFHAFEAACLVMSGIGVGLLHLSCGRQKATLGSFSGAGFWTGWA